MIASVVNAAAVIVGSLLGILFGHRVRKEHMDTIAQGLSIVVLVIGIGPAIATDNILAVIICLVAGTILGEFLDIERRLDGLGDALKARFARKSGGSFTQGFVTASLLMCIGSMAVMGSLDAGIRHDYSILFSKSVIDGVMAVTFAAAMGIGVAFAALPLFVYQGALTLLASFLAPYLSDAVITEMSAVGGILLIATALNMLEILPRRIRVGNLLPAILLPILYIPLANWLASAF